MKRLEKAQNQGLQTVGLPAFNTSDREVKKQEPFLKEAMEIKSHITYIKTIGDGETVSYGNTYKAIGDRKIATIPVGYADGYPRLLSSVGRVIINGSYAPIAGRICMDQFMVDVTDIENVEFADKVTLIGYDGDEHLPVEVLSEMSGRFNYEFVCDLSKRIPREFLRHGEVIEQMDCFA